MRAVFVDASAALAETMERLRRPDDMPLTVKARGALVEAAMRHRRRVARDSAP